MNLRTPARSAASAISTAAAREAGAEAAVCDLEATAAAEVAVLLAGANDPWSLASRHTFLITRVCEWMGMDVAPCTLFGAGCHIHTFGGLRIGVMAAAGRAGPSRSVPG
jgi:hypothetical protein